MLVPVLIYIRIPCRIDPERHFNATILTAVMFWIVLPFVWMCRDILGRLIGNGLVIAYCVLSLIPYRFFVKTTEDWCERYVHGQTIAGYPAYVLPLGIIVLAMGISALFLKLRKIALFPESRKTYLILIALLVLATVQVIPRMGNNSPKSVAGNWQKPETPYHRSVFEGYRYGGWDHPIHMVPGALYRGADVSGERYLLVINRRSFGHYWHSLFAPLMNPYNAAISINLFLFFLVLALSFRFGKKLGLSTFQSVLFPILLSANHRLLWATDIPYFYMPYYLGSWLLLWALYKYNPFEGSFKQKLLFAGSTLWVATTYDPMFLTMVLFAWGLLRWRVTHLKGTVVHFAGTVGLAAVPTVTQTLFGALLTALHMEGSTRDVVQRNLLGQKLVQLPSYIVHDTWEFLTMLDRNVIQIGVINRTNTNEIEYWSILGMLGVIALFAVLPRYIKKRPFNDMLVFILCSVAIQVLVSLADNIPPKNIFDTQMLRPDKIQGTIIMVLAQTLGICFVVERLLQRSPIVVQRVAISALIAIIWLLSFGRLYLS